MIGFATIFTTQVQGCSYEGCKIQIVERSKDPARPSLSTHVPVRFQRPVEYVRLINGLHININSFDMYETEFIWALFDNYYIYYTCISPLQSIRSYSRGTKVAYRAKTHFFCTRKVYSWNFVY